MNDLCEWVCYPPAWGKSFAFLLKIVFLNYGRSNPARKLLRAVERKPVIEMLRNFGTALVSVWIMNLGMTCWISRILD